MIGGLYSLSVALSNTFVNIYLWKQQSDYMTIAIYNLSIVIAQPIVFIIAGRWAKQVDRIIVLRLGVFSLSIFYLVVLLLGKLAVQYVIILGVLLGIGFGFYWLAFNVLTFEITEPETRDLFNGFFGLLGSFAGMIGPFLAGWLITKLEGMKGYTLIFGISLGLFVVAIILSFFLKRRSAEGKFKLMNVLRWSEITRNWKRILLANFAQGLREGSFAFLIFIWIYIAAGTELALGTFSLVTSAISFVVYYLAGRFISQKYRIKSILAGALLLSLSVWIIAFHLTFTKLMIYGVVISIAFPILMVPFISMTYDIIGKAKHAAEWRIEYVVGRELFLNAGRIISILLFMALITFFEEKKSLPYFIIALGNAQLLLYFIIRKIKL
ncbi:MFS transporter [Caldalkalibacillus mannanilyticus]|uniref:MFS transporter n=1 Tax=Caldalkalibacillus mannanilyticus TaxID=1418 RepID=UPI0004681B25|nr:MFS transporter [Caldalkalibacillus mannanilyticus]